MGGHFPQQVAICLLREGMNVAEDFLREKEQQKLVKRAKSHFMLGTQMVIT